MKLNPPAPSTFIDLLQQALAEDLGPGDVTSQTLIDQNLTANAIIIAKQPGILAGLIIIEPLIDLLGGKAKMELLASDGEVVEPQQQVVRLNGSAQGILALERLALNFLSHLSGIATLTNKFVQAVQGTSAVICDTRKTTPGMRLLEKYAVRAGGGCNHRLGLYDSAMIKDNHLLCLSDAAENASVFAVLKQRLSKLREQLPSGGFVQLEVDNLEQLQQVLALQLDIDMVLLDNFSEADLARAVQMRNQAKAEHRILLEASGNVDLQSVGRIAATGVDRISIGALTHSAPALDFSMEFTPE